MVYLITGPRNSGKTTKLLVLFKRLKGGGIASVKGKMDGYEFYRMVFLGSAQSPVLLATENPLYADNKGFFPFKRFYFSESAFKKGHLYITQLIALSVSPIFLDEVGQLELKGMGFHDICFKLMGLQSDVYITVRDTNLYEFLKVFRPKNYEILEKGE